MTLLRYKLPILIITVVYAAIILLLTNVMSEQAYESVASTVKSATDGLSEDAFGPIGNAAITLVATITSTATSSGNSAVQQIDSTTVALLLSLFIWLTVVWFLRNRLAGHKVKVRDAFYNAGGPVLSSFVVLIVMIIQLVPIALAFAAIVAGVQTGLFQNGAASMLLCLSVSLLVLLSLYWITASFMGLIIITLPGMYPLRALKIAGDMVVGRRIRIVLRILWLLLVIFVAWILIMIPVIIFDGWLKQVLPIMTNFPLVPFVIEILGTFTIVWAASYTYLLYRKVVDDDALPA